MAIKTAAFIFRFQTIFEINATAKKTSHAVMRAKRGLHDRIIQRAQDNKAPAFLTQHSADHQRAPQPASEDEEEALVSGRNGDPARLSVV